MKRIRHWLHKTFGKSDSQKLRDKVLNEDIDFSDLVSSSLLAKDIYDELKMVAHPDRFQDPNEIVFATELFKEITQNKGNYKTLLKIKERVYNELLKKY